MPTHRIQRSRTRGSRLPAGAVVVDRTTPWGNPFRVGVHGTAAECVDAYADMIAGKFRVGPDWPSVEDQEAAARFVREHIAALRGRDLACWCRVGAPCHADVLLRLVGLEPGELISPPK